MRRKIAQVAVDTQVLKSVSFATDFSMANMALSNDFAPLSALAVEDIEQMSPNPLKNIIETNLYFYISSCRRWN